MLFPEYSPVLKLNIGIVNGLLLSKAIKILKILKYHKYYEFQTTKTL